MLERMYVRWAEARDYKVEIIGEHYGEEAGIKSGTVLIKGTNAYGWLKTESGVHRLVRISPFDSNARRHTSFASVSVYPAIDDTIEIDIDDKDVRIDTYRSSAQAASTSTPPTAPCASRICRPASSCTCQNERSQHKNRATAWAMLRARLYEAELKRREEEAQAAAAAKSDIGFGHQIRSYVLQPYQLVKDLRTGRREHQSLSRARRRSSIASSRRRSPSASTPTRKLRPSVGAAGPIRGAIQPSRYSAARVDSGLPPLPKLVACSVGRASKPAGLASGARICCRLAILDLRQRIVGAARLPLEIGALLDGEALMEDIALDMGLRLQRHAQAADRADDAAAHHDILGDHAAHHLRLVAEQERAAMNVALDLAVDLDLALRGHVAGDASGPRR